MLARAHCFAAFAAFLWGAELGELAFCKILETKACAFLAPIVRVVTHLGSVLEGLATISESLSSLSDGLLHERSNVGNDRTLGWCEQ